MVKTREVQVALYDSTGGKNWTGWDVETIPARMEYLNEWCGLHVQRCGSVHPKDVQWHFPPETSTINITEAATPRIFGTFIFTATLRKRELYICCPKEGI